MSKEQFTNFDITQYLDSKEAITEYLTQVLEDDNSDEILEAFGNIALLELNLN